eukprot:425192-Hanusia_phi.AAC.2
MRKRLREAYASMFGTVVEVDCTKTAFKRFATSEGPKEEGGSIRRNGGGTGDAQTRVDRRPSTKRSASSLLKQLEDSAKKIKEDLSSQAEKPSLTSAKNCLPTVVSLARNEEMLDAKMKDMRRLLRIGESCFAFLSLAPYTATDAQEVTSFCDEFSSKRERSGKGSEKTSTKHWEHCEATAGDYETSQVRRRWKETRQPDASD